jgi:uncharacterized OB-fold protein
VPDMTTRFYWEGAKERTLFVQRCPSCDHYLHPPSIACPRCLCEDLVPTQVSGRGTIFTFTIARQAFDSSFEVPYVLALVELDEQPGLRVLTNIVGVPPEEVTVGAAVEVDFERRGAWSLPQFRLAGQGTR